MLVEKLLEYAGGDVVRYELLPPSLSLSLSMVVSYRCFSHPLLSYALPGGGTTFLYGTPARPVPPARCDQSVEDCANI